MRLAPVALALIACTALSAPPLAARTAKAPALTPHPAAEEQVLDLSKRLISLRSVRGPDNQTGKAMGVVKAALLAGGWKDSEVEIVPVDDTSYMIATWPGSDPKLKPLVISGHLDVVEADPRTGPAIPLPRWSKTGSSMAAGRAT